MHEDLMWLSEWFSHQCDGDWEHEYGIRIGTLDNPGWRLRISLIGTNLENKEFKKISNKKSESN